MAYSLFQDAMKNRPRTGDFFPPASTIASAGAFGAILGMATSGVTNYGKVKAGEITEQDAVQDTLNSGAVSAGTMAAASVAAHIVRVHPVIGFAALAAVGVGVLASARKAAQQKEVEDVGAAQIEIEVEAAG